jgi:hypothetical protein
MKKVYKPLDRTYLTAEHWRSKAATTLKASDKTKTRSE